MFGSFHNPAKAYAKVGIETGVIAATPHQLILMLFDGAIVSVDCASKEIALGDIEAKGRAVSRAMTIIESGLRTSLNKKVGGEIALNLDALYAYMNNRLFTASLYNDAGILGEVRRLLVELKEAWEKIPSVSAIDARPPVFSPAPPPAPAPASRHLHIGATVPPRSEELPVAGTGNSTRFALGF